MTGTKFGCGMALCCACTVHIDGAPIRSCVTPIDSIGISEVTTIEAIGATASGAKIQKAWLSPRGADSAGTASLARSCLLPHCWQAIRIRRNPTSTRRCRNICRCGTYVRIRDAIKQAAAS